MSQNNKIIFLDQYGNYSNWNNKYSISWIENGYNTLEQSITKIYLNEDSLFNSAISISSARGTGILSTIATWDELSQFPMLRNRELFAINVKVNKHYDIYDPCKSEVLCKDLNNRSGEGIDGQYIIYKNSCQNILKTDNKNLLIHNVDLVKFITDPKFYLLRLMYIDVILAIDEHGTVLAILKNVAATTWNQASKTISYRMNDGKTKEISVNSFKPICDVNDYLIRRHGECQNFNLLY